MTEKNYNKVCNKCGILKTFCEFVKKKDCINGITSICKECKNKSERISYSTNKEKANKRSKKWNNKNKEKMVLISKNWRENNREKEIFNRKKWTDKNKEKIAFINKEWQKNNKNKVNATSMRYIANKIKATPLWFEKDKIDLVYKKAMEWNMQVDHIIPLKGKNVCGLHCWANLQLLDSSLNQSKGNRLLTN